MYKFVRCLEKILLLGCFMVLMMLPAVAMADPIATLDQISPIPTTYGLISDFYPFRYTAVGDVTASLVDDVGLGGTSSDFAGFPAGSIALIERGTYNFQLKVENAAAAGAVGAIIYDNNVQDDAFLGTLLSLSSIPALLVTNDVGLSLLGLIQEGPVAIHMATYTSEPPLINQAPEPSTLILVGIGLAGVGLLRRKVKS